MKGLLKSFEDEQILQSLSMHNFLRSEKLCLNAAASTLRPLKYMAREELRLDQAKIPFGHHSRQRERVAALIHVRERV